MTDSKTTKQARFKDDYAGETPVQAKHRAQSAAYVKAGVAATKRNRRRWD